MARTKKEQKIEDTRSFEEKELSLLAHKISSGNFTSEDKLEMDKIVKKLNEKGISHPYQGIGRYYAVRVDGDEDLITFKLVASNPSIFGEVNEASIEAPMGNAVRFLEEGQSTSYSVIGENVVVTLIAVTDTYEELVSRTTEKEPVKELGTM